MYLVILKEHFHCNKKAFIVLEKYEIIDFLISHLENWDVPFSQKELESTLIKGSGMFNEHSKSYVKVTIIEIKPGESFDLD
jgi:hypothetical protein